MTTPADAGWYRHQSIALGIITPSANLVVERVTTAILADFPEVSAHFSRTPVFGSSDPYPTDYDWDGMMGAARLLGHAHPSVICWNGSKGTTLGFPVDRDLCQRITAETGAPATTSSLAIEATLQAKNLHDIGLVTPYPDAYQRRLVDRFAAEGINCVAEAHAGESDNLSYANIPDETIIAMIRKVAAARPPAIVTFCTNLPSAHLVAPLERELGLPIYDSVSAGIWHALRLANVDTARGVRWGSLFGSTP